MPGQRPLRTLSEPEFNTIRDKLLSEAPDGLSERDFHLWVTPRLAFEVGKAEAEPEKPQGSAIGRFASGAAEMLNPVAMVQGLAHAVRHPIDTATNIGAGMLEQGQKAIASAREGDPSSAIGHGLATVLPVIGPAAANVGERMAEGFQGGDLAGSMGGAAGLLAPMGAPAAIRSAGRMVRNAAPEGVVAATAKALEDGAATRAADVMSPKVGANKVRFGNMAEDVAPAVASKPELSAWTREGLHGKVQSGLAQAEKGLDAASDARLSARTFETKPLVDGLLERRKRLTSESVKAEGVEFQPIGVDGKHVTTWTKPTGKPVGSDVVPAPNAARVAEIDRAIGELRQLGPVARYESIRRIREAYDGPAKAVYNPSMTADFLKAQGGKLGAADVTGVLRENLAKWDPQTAAANSEYSLYRKMDDVLEATREVERTRPAVGRRIMGRLTGVIFGNEAAGPAGAVAGYIAGPAVDSLLSSGVTTKLKTAQLMSRLATAIRKGDEGAVVSATYALKRLAAQGAALTPTSPSGFQTQTTAPAR